MPRKQSLYTFITTNKLKRRNPLKLKPVNLLCILICYSCLSISSCIITFIYKVHLIFKLTYLCLALCSWITHIITVLADPGFVDIDNCPFDFSDQHVVLEMQQNQQRESSESGNSSENSVAASELAKANQNSAPNAAKNQKLSPNKGQNHPRLAVSETKIDDAVSLNSNELSVDMALLSGQDSLGRMSPISLNSNEDLLPDRALSAESGLFSGNASSNHVNSLKNDDRQETLTPFSRSSNSSNNSSNNSNSLMIRPSYYKNQRTQSVNPNWSLCNKCESYRPLRAHHCRICNRCINKMDHHCPWIGNCVGQDNQRSFVQFLVYLLLTSLLAFLLSLKKLINFNYGVISGYNQALMSQKITPAPIQTSEDLLARVTNVSSLGSSELVFVEPNAVSLQNQTDFSSLQTLEYYQQQNSLFTYYVMLLLTGVVFTLFSAAILFEQLQSIMKDETAIEYLIRQKNSRLNKRRKNLNLTANLGFRSNQQTLEQLNEDSHLIMNVTNDDVPRHLSGPTANRALDVEEQDLASRSSNLETFSQEDSNFVSNNTPLKNLQNIANNSDLPHYTRRRFENQPLEKQNSLSKTHNQPPKRIGYTRLKRVMGPNLISWFLPFGLIDDLPLKMQFSNKESSGVTCYSDCCIEQPGLGGTGMYNIYNRQNTESKNFRFIKSRHVNIVINNLKSCLNLFIGSRHSRDGYTRI